MYLISNNATITSKNSNTNSLKILERLTFINFNNRLLKYRFFAHSEPYNHI